jgi:hypothetical protein
MSSSYRRLYALLGAGALIGLGARASADNWQLLPRLELGGTYNDNYRLAEIPADKVQVYGPYLDAQLDASLRTQLSTLEIVPRVRSTYFPSDAADQSTAGYLDIDGEHRTQRSDFALLAHYSNESVIYSELLPATFPGVALGQVVGGESGRVTSRNRRQLERVDPAFTYDLSQRSHLDLQGRFDHATYDKSLIQQVGFTNYQGSAGWRYDVTPRTDVRVTGVVGRFEPQSGGHNTDRYGANFQWDLQPTQIMRAYLRIGANRTQANTAVGTISDTGVTGGAGLVWNYQITQVVLDVMRALSPSAAGAEVTDDEVRFRVLHAFRPRFSGFLGVRGVRLRGVSDRQPLAIQGEDYLAAEVGCEYQITESYRVATAYDYTWQRFQGEPSAASNAVRISLIYQPLNRFEPLPEFTGIPQGVAADIEQEP